MSKLKSAASIVAAAVDAAIAGGLRRRLRSDVTDDRTTDDDTAPTSPDCTSVPMLPPTSPPPLPPRWSNEDDDDDFKLEVDTEFHWPTTADYRSDDASAHNADVTTCPDVNGSNDDDGQDVSVFEPVEHHGSARGVVDGGPMFVADRQPDNDDGDAVGRRHINLTTSYSTTSAIVINERLQPKKRQPVERHQSDSAAQSRPTDPDSTNIRATVSVQRHSSDKHNDPWRPKSATIRPNTDDFDWPLSTPHSPLVDSPFAGYSFADGGRRPRTVSATDRWNGGGGRSSFHAPRSTRECRIPPSVSAPRYGSLRVSKSGASDDSIARWEYQHQQQDIGRPPHRPGCCSGATCRHGRRTITPQAETRLFLENDRDGKRHAYISTTGTDLYKMLAKSERLKEEDRRREMEGQVGGTQTELGMDSTTKANETNSTTTTKYCSVHVSVERHAPDCDVTSSVTPDRLTTIADNVSREEKPTVCVQRQLSDSTSYRVFENNSSHGQPQVELSLQAKPEGRDLNTLPVKNSPGCSDSKTSPFPLRRYASVDAASPGRALPISYRDYSAQVFRTAPKLGCYDADGNRQVMRMMSADVDWSSARSADSTRVRDIVQRYRTVSDGRRVPPEGPPRVSSNEQQANGRLRKVPQYENVREPEFSTRETHIGIGFKDRIMSASLTSLDTGLSDDVRSSRAIEDLALNNGWCEIQPRAPVSYDSNPSRQTERYERTIRQEPYNNNIHIKPTKNATSNGSRVSGERQTCSKNGPVFVSEFVISISAGRPVSFSRLQTSSDSDRQMHIVSSKERSPPEPAAVAT